MRSRTRAGLKNVNSPTALQDETLELIGFSRGAIEARDLAKRLDEQGRQVDLLVLVDPELRSNLRIPGNVRVVVKISDGDDRSMAVAEDPESTIVINLRIPEVTRHRDVDDADPKTNPSRVLDFINALTLRAELGFVLTRELIESLAAEFGLEVFTSR